MYWLIPDFLSLPEIFTKHCIGWTPMTDNGQTDIKTNKRTDGWTDARKKRRVSLSVRLLHIEFDTDRWQRHTCENHLPRVALNAERLKTEPTISNRTFNSLTSNRYATKSQNVQQDAIWKAQHSPKVFITTNHSAINYNYYVGGVAHWLGRRSLAGRLSLVYAQSVVDRWTVCG